MIEPSAFLEHWLGHRRVIEVFPDDQLFAFSPAPPLRPFGEMAWELVGQTGYTLDGLLTGQWGEPVWDTLPSTHKAALLAAWDAQTARIEAGLPGVPLQRYGEILRLAWGEMLVFNAVIGAVDNEIHHRGQGMVYLRHLGITPATRPLGHQITGDFRMKTKNQIGVGA